MNFFDSQALQTFWTNFHFIRPSWLLAMIPMLLVIWRISKSSMSEKGWQGVIDPALLPHVLIGQENSARHWPRIILGILGSLAIIAMAGPTWEQLPQPVFRNDAAMVIALDLSRSMDAPDQKPSRLTTARFKIIDLLKQRKEGQTALLVYAGTAFTVTPLTDDNETILSQLEALSTDLMPQQGSRADQAMIKARDLLRQAGILNGDVLLISDELKSDTDVAMAKQLRKDGYRVFVLGMGTTEGAPIPKVDGGYVTDAAGNIVLPTLDEAALKAVAQAGGGYYQKSTLDDSDVNLLTKKLSKISIESENVERELRTDQWREEGPILLLLILPFAAYIFRRGYLVILLCCISSLVYQPKTFAAELWKRADQQAQKLLEQGDAKQAAELFEDPQWKASAQYKAGDYESALETWDKIDTETIKDDEALYNKANAQAKLGRLEEALKSYQQVLEDNPDHDDAQHNLQQVKKAIEEQKKQQDQKQQDQKGDQGKNQEQKEEQDKKDKQDKESEKSNEGKQGEGQKSDPEGKEGESNQDQKQESNPEDEQLGNKESDQKKPEQDQTDQQKAQKEKGEEEKSDEKKAADQAAKEQAEKEAAEMAKAGQQDLEEDKTQDETQQAVEAALRAIPDDPGGLLRRKFLYQYRQQGAGKTDEEQQW